MADSEESGSSRGFKVQDRRRFTAEGEARPQAPQPEAATASAVPPAPEPAAQPTAARPEINFTTFLISLGTQALMFLGEISQPEDSGAQADPEAAREMIDIIAMLKEKTAGNLDAAETGLIDGFLYDLRLKYVEVVRKRSQP